MSRTYTVRVRQGVHMSKLAVLLSFLGQVFHIRNNTNGLVQERRNSIANALEFSLTCTNPFSICDAFVRVVYINDMNSKEFTTQLAMGFKHNIWKRWNAINIWCVTQIFHQQSILRKFCYNMYCLRLSIIFFFDFWNSPYKVIFIYPKINFISKNITIHCNPNCSRGITAFFSTTATLTWDLPVLVSIQLSDNDLWKNLIKLTLCMTYHR